MTILIKPVAHACHALQRRRCSNDRKKPRFVQAAADGGDNGGGGRDNGTLPAAATDRAAARLIAAGVTGSLAVAGAALTGVDLSGALRFDAASAQAALPLFAPLALLDIALLAPNWQLPPSLMGGGGGASPPESSSSSSSSGGGGGGGSVDLAAVDAAGVWSGPALALTLALHQRACLAAPRGRSNDGNDGDKGSNNLGPSLLLEAPLVAARAAGQEALRASAALALAGWLADRLREAGAGDGIELPAWAQAAWIGLRAGGGGGETEVPLQLVALALGAALTALALLPLPVIVAAEAQEIAAAALLLESREGRAMAALRREQERRRQQRWQRRQQQEQQQRQPARPAASPTEQALDLLLSQPGRPTGGQLAADASIAAAASIAASTAAADAAGAAEIPRTSLLEKDGVLKGGTSATTASGAAGTTVTVGRVVVEVGGDDVGSGNGSGDDDIEAELLVAEFRLQAASERAAAGAPARACGVLAFARGAGRLAAAGAALPVAGGSWGAPLLGALTLDAVLLVCSLAHGGRRGNGPAR